MGTFEDNMFRQSQANPLSGFITAGAAKLMSDRTLASSKIMENLNAALQAENDTPLSTFDQIAKLNDDPTAKEQLKSIEQDAASYQAFVGDVINKREKYGEIYDEALQKLAFTGGEEAERLMSQLEGSRAEKIAQLQAIANLPADKLKFAGMKLEYDWNREKYDSWYNDKVLRQDIADVADWMTATDMFQEIEGGDVLTWDQNKLDDFTQKQKTLVQKAYDYFGGQKSKGAISSAFKVAMDNAGKSFKFQEMNPLQKQQLKSLKAQSAMQIAQLKGILSAMSEKYLFMNEDTRNDLKTYMSTGEIPQGQRTEEQQKSYEDEIKAMGDVYKPTGEYMLYYSQLSALDPDNFTQDAFEKKTLSSGNTIPVPKDASYWNILRPQGFSGFMRGSHKYNPYSWMIERGAQKQKLTKLGEGTFSRNAADSFTMDIRELFKKQPLLNQIQNDFEGLFLDFGESFGLTVNPYIKEEHARGE